MADKYSLTKLKSLAGDANLFLPQNASKETVYELLLLLDMIDTSPREDDCESGIIGWDVTYTPSRWVVDATGHDWNPKVNPVLKKNKTWIFHADDIILDIIDPTIEFIRSCKGSGKTGQFNKLYNRVINVSNGNIKEELKDLIDSNDKYTVALIGWQNHMRFLYHDSSAKVLQFFDPWKLNQDKTPFFKRMKSILKKEFGYTAIFVNREKEQSEENSCVINALSRVIMICEKGLDSVSLPWTPDLFDYAVFASRALRINMRKYYKDTERGIIKQ